MEFTHRNVANYLRHKLGKPCDIVDIEKFGRGSSRETWFITFRTDGASEEHLVFRRDPSAGATDYSLLHQVYLIYERLGRTNVSVANS